MTGGYERRGKRGKRWLRRCGGGRPWSFAAQDNRKGAKAECKTESLGGYKAEYLLGGVVCLMGLGAQPKKGGKKKGA